MIYTVEMNEKLIDEFKKEVKEIGENESNVLHSLLMEYLEDLRDSRQLDKAIEESNGNFHNLDSVIKDLGLENEIL